MQGRKFLFSLLGKEKKLIEPGLSVINQGFLECERASLDLVVGKECSFFQEIFFLLAEHKPFKHWQSQTEM